ncbi:M24 family metallopeptidase [Bordetella pseudohinzii]|uniref:Xaa-Pro aminopeptidase n=1 Tax=Bordetella pseudohinzii TaxID=1331258 RepID=A0A0J6F598_9BORD|nr:M24 family metallopeptidase [Bordetella pseudohinzii]ANY16453.1 hypothetical protein BBN53_11430 [Bordetella pseudohinzii]KMM27595.1 hypothetical protein L540_00945 [Bordetella pseudohinzii]KXA78161.1 hypothetical protein AW877_12210 [Bordetella pseudohinzii]KXA82059.1 hypothetical protein AW878_02045 [Bordetella pseudohinzii]CUI36452.1 Xaa-Pro aminopeptidase [Bordetella pseudohinzii]
MNTPDNAIAAPAQALADLARVRAFMKADGVDLICAKENDALYYLSGHYSDSTLCQFYDDWACALIPASAGVDAALVIQEYDLAYQATKPTWLPELRVYGSPWSSAGTLLKDIAAGQGVETDLRQPLRELIARTAGNRSEDLASAIVGYVQQHFGDRELVVACDDMRYHDTLRAALGGRARIIDARPLLRRIRAVKTENEIALLTRAARINIAALGAAAGAVRADGPWADMVQAYRNALAAQGAKPLGERGMLFNSGPDGSFVLDHDYVERKRFAPGDVVVMDAICEYRLYRADMARTAIIGPASAAQRRMFQAVRTALEVGEAAMKAGVHTAEIAGLAAEVMRKHGFRPEATTLTLHPIGLDIFDYAEPGHVSRGWVLEPDSVVNFEVFYRDSEHGGAHLEDSVRIGAQGAAALVPTDRELLEIG